MNAPVYPPIGCGPSLVERVERMGRDEEKPLLLEMARQYREQQRRIDDLIRQQGQALRIGTEVARYLKRRHPGCGDNPCAVGHALNDWATLTGEEL